MLAATCCLHCLNTSLITLLIKCMIKTEDFETIEIKSAKQLRSWLTKNHSSDQSIWLISHKKSEGSSYVSREEVLDELISFGWIDGIRRKLDDKRTMQLISKRRTQHWLRSYKERAVRLEKSGKMHASGLDSIKNSKALGLLDFIDDVDNLLIPDDLRKELSQKGEALTFFESINPSSMRFVLRWLKLSKTEKTRKSRIKKLVDLSIKGEKLPGS